MKENSRTQNSIKNSIVSVISQVFIILISFIGRTFFIKFLGSEYLGINGLFTDILSILSFAELGVGTAIIYSLYKPISDKDEKKISAYVNLYATTYRIIGFIILIIGIMIIPFLPYLIKDFEQYTTINIRLIYILFLLNSSMTYFYSYKRSLIVANQKKYIDSINRIVCLVFLNIVQIFILYITKNYILYLCIQILFSILENVSITIIANKLYPFINNYKKERLNNNEKKELIKNVKSLVLHKIGSTLVSNTDNLLISAYIGLNIVGIYSNYSMIITAIKTVLNQMFASITASVGNLNVEENNEKSYNIFSLILFTNFWIVCIITTLIIAVLNDFIIIWLGEEYLLSLPILIAIVINFFLYEMRQTLFIYKNTYGLFQYDRYVPIIEAIINLVVSIVFLRIWGIMGIFIGTIISTLTTCFWVEPYFLYKKKFNKNLMKYFKQYFMYVVITIVIIIITTGIGNSIVPQHNIFLFILKAVICFIIPNLILIIIFHKTKELKYYINIIKKGRGAN